MTVPLRRRLWVGVTVVGVLGAVGGWWADAPHAPRSGVGAVAAGRPPAASAPGDAAAPERLLAAPTAGTLSIPVVPAPVDSAVALARAQLKQRMKADWCGFGAAEQSRQADAVLEKAGAHGGLIGMDAIAELNSTPGAEVVEEAVAQVRQRWVRALLQRGDPRAVAVAEYLGGADGDEARARARLQALARTSADPMVTALALQRPCGAGSCRNVERAQWSRLEPANLQAWLMLLGDARARQTQEAYALERMASEARYSISYERELKTLLLGLPQTEAPGLAQDAELQLIISTTAAWPTPSMRPVMELCRTRAADPVVQHRCAAVAELMWQGENLLERGMATSLVRHLMPARAGLQAQWQPRAREFEAARHWSAFAAERAASAAEPAAQACGMQAEWRGVLQATAAQGEWGRIRAEMQAARADDAALSAEWRRSAGRSVLDPLPLPASAAR
jgi:hypothetical protein